MSHNNPNNRHRLAVPEPKPEAESKPTVKPTTATVYNLTNHFSKLNPNPPPTKSPTYPQSQTKALSKSAVLETSNRSLGNEFVKQGKRVVSEGGKDGRNQEEGGKKEVVLKRKEVKNGIGIGKRVSFCDDAEAELGKFLVNNSAKLVAADMPPFLQIHAIGFARKVKDSLEKFTSKTLALSLKKEFDGEYGPAWHCIVGGSFGSFVTHSVGGFLYFQLDQKLYVLLFKTTVQRVH